MKTLYIVGNGFDLHHGLDTHYQSFAVYLATNNREIYDLLLHYYYLPDIAKADIASEECAYWSRFEEALADLDYETLLDDNNGLVANPGDDDFRARDWHSYSIEMEMIVDKLTTQLIGAFNRFILDLKYPDPQRSLLKMEMDSYFFSFNYTESLQRFYNVPTERIKYIHSKADEKECSLILGHGIDPGKFVESNEEEPKGFSEEQHNEWLESQSDQYDYSYKSAKNEVLGYYYKAFKNTTSIIVEHEDCFNKYRDIEEVTVLGHSLGDLDIKYFEKIKSCVQKNATWYVSYYNDREKCEHFEKLLSLRIAKEKIVQIQMKNILLK